MGHMLREVALVLQMGLMTLININHMQSFWGWERERVYKEV